MLSGEQLLQSLMRASLAGNAAAHGALLQALWPVLRRFFIRRMGAKENVVDDLVQEVLIAVHEKRSTYNPERPFGAWLFAIARYKMIDQLRRFQDETPLHDLQESLAVSGEIDASDASIDVESLLAHLNTKQAEAIRATQVEGLSVAEAAARQQISVADLKVSVHRGLKSLAARVRGRP